MDTRHAFQGYLDRLYRQNARQWAFRGETTRAFGTWQVSTRRRLRRLLTLHQRQKVAPGLRRQPHSETREYTRERVEYQTLAGVVVPAWLLIPKGVRLPVPGVLCPPGHGKGMNQVLDEEPGIYKRYPIEIVRRGMVALVPEHLGFGERAGAEGDNRRSNHAYLYHALNLLGESQLGLMAWDLMRALDVLQGLPEVVASRIGCYGLSLGGETTLLLSALDTRVRVACISGFLCSYKSSFLAEAHCGCGYSFALARQVEHVDLASLIAPRPLAIESALDDPIFPIAEARRTCRALRAVYTRCGAKEKLVQDAFDGKHEISGAAALDWLARWLSA